MELLLNIVNLILVILMLAILLIGLTVPFIIKWMFRYWIFKKTMDWLKK